MGFFAILVSGVIRADMSFAITKMVNKTEEGLLVYECIEDEIMSNDSSNIVVEVCQNTNINKLKTIINF